MTNTEHGNDARVKTWTGERGRVEYRTEDGWYGVQLDGERRVDEWQGWQLTAE